MSIFDQFLFDPRGTLLILLIALPGRLLAISAHEAAHGWVADRCGDPTARLMGRVTLNPLKHFDVVGTLCMLVFGFGWAKPVPVNPLNFRNYRRDDLKVALAGVTMNLTLFLGGCVILYAMIGLALAQIPFAENAMYASQDLLRFNADGVAALWTGNGWYRVADLLQYPWACQEVLIAPVFGETVRYLYQMVYYFITSNLVLAIFNLIPIPPLDGYHVLNDLILKRPLFADQRAQVIGMVLLFVFVSADVFSSLYTGAMNGVLGVLGRAVLSLFQGIGLF